MIIKCLLFGLIYLFIGWVVDRIMTDPENPEGFDVTIIIMFIWPLIIGSLILTWIMVLITTPPIMFFEWLKRKIKKNKARNKCKTCLYNKSASSRPVCLECNNFNLYEPEEE